VALTGVRAYDNDPTPCYGYADCYNIGNPDSKNLGDRWTFPWASSLGSDFNFNVSFTEEQQRDGVFEYNYQRGGHYRSGASTYLSSFASLQLAYYRECNEQSGPFNIIKSDS
jgi:hypothetical protein